ncbi:hypothetical protein AYI70_g5031, partial [Smittium culicis]
MDTRYSSPKIVSKIPQWVLGSLDNRESDTASSNSSMANYKILHNKPSNEIADTKLLGVSLNEAISKLTGFFNNFLAS